MSGVTTDEAARLLGIELPTNRNTIVTAFRRKAREEHPDVSKHPQADERFCAIRAAKEVLENDPTCLDFDERSSDVRCTDDGTVLADLGKGLGPNVNGRPCDDCAGRGYRMFTDVGVVDCADCHGWGTRILPKSGARLGCRKCKGRGSVDVKKRSYYFTCRTCKGCGEIKIYNPVLPKGLLR